MPRGIPNNPDIARRAGQKSRMETIEIPTEGGLTRQVKIERRERRGGGVSGVNKFKFNRPEFERSGYNRYWAADNGMRLEELFNDDYDYVLNEKGEKIKQFGGTDKFGNKFDHYLMEKPLDWFEEDKRKKLESASLEQEQKNNQAIAGVSRGLNIYRPKSDDNAALAEID